MALLQNFENKGNNKLIVTMGNRGVPPPVGSYLMFAGMAQAG